MNPAFSRQLANPSHLTRVLVRGGCNDRELEEWVQQVRMVGFKLMASLSHVA